MSKQSRDISRLIRFSDREYNLIMERAADNNMKFSTYMRFMAMSEDGLDPKLRKLITKLINEVNYIGHNINQIVRNNNSGLYLESDKVRLMEYMRTLNLKVGAVMEKNGY